MVWWFGSTLARSGSVLAQAESVGGSFVELLPRLLVVLVCAVVLVVGVSILRRKLRDDDGGEVRDFSLGDLRRLKAEGKLTQEELDRAKGALVGRVQSKLAKPADDAKPRDVGAEMK